MKRSFSDVMLVVYGLVLPLLLITAVLLTLAPASQPYGALLPLPRPVLLVVAYLLPALVALRLWMHVRARKLAAPKAPETETPDV